jgi:hypothetical protein
MSGRLPSRQFLAVHSVSVLDWVAIGVSLINIVRETAAFLHPAMRLEIPATASSNWGRWILIVAGIAAWILLRVSRVRIWVRRVILGPPTPSDEFPMLFRGPRPYKEGDVLPGRKADIDQCWIRILEKSFLIVEGESGSGKTSLLNAGVLPRARETFQVFSCRMGTEPLPPFLAAWGQRGQNGSLAHRTPEVSGVSRKCSKELILSH